MNLGRSILLLFLLAAPLSATEKEIPYDLILRHGLIVDGSGHPPYSGDIAIAEGRIARIGDLTGVPAARTLDATGLVVAPGFIDLLCHNDLFWSRAQQEKAVREGVTTGLGGNCGFSVLDVEKNLHKLLYQNKMLNIGTLLGQGSIRDWFIKTNRRRPATLTELDQMRAFLEQGLRAGAFGLSSGLGYEPGEWCTPDELQALATGLAKFPHAAYYTHIRNYRSNVLEAMREAVEVAERVKVPVVIQHLLFKLPSNWDLTESGLAILEDARTRGLRVYATVYPYDFWGNEVQIPLHQFLYRKADIAHWWYYYSNSRREEVLDLIRKRLGQYGGADKVEITQVKSKAFRSFLGLSIGDLARKRKVSPENAVLALLLENGPAVKVCYHGLSEEGLIKKIQSPYILFGSDSTGNIPHPRDVGAFPRLLGTYVRDKRVIRLSEAIHRLTEEPARLMGLKDRGSLKEGYWADLAVFDLATIKDNASAVSPWKTPSGMKYVVVNGQVVFDDGKFFEGNPGQVLKRRDD